MGIGDEIMCTGHVRQMQLTDPRKVRLEYGKRLWNQVFDNNPRIARPKEEGDFQVYRPRGVNGLRPYIASKSQKRWEWLDYKPLVGELYFTPDELVYASSFSPDVVIEPHNKPEAPVNKMWGWDRWQRLADLLRACDIQPVQLGDQFARRIAGAHFIETRTFRLAAAIIARSRVAVLPEGGLHHAAAAVGVPSVVIYGGYISPRQTGYDLHVNLFTGEKPCGWRIPCKHCEEAMAKITPEQVFEEARRLWKAASTPART